MIAKHIDRFPLLKKDGKFKFGYKQHITPANAHECNHLEPLLAGIETDDTTVCSDKGYDSKANREH